MNIETDVENDDDVDKDDEILTGVSKRGSIDFNDGYGPATSTQSQYAYYIEKDRLLLNNNILLYHLYNFINLY